MDRDELYMQRCFDLALLGAGKVSPNPMVGAVLVYEGRIIGEGYHRAYGEAHAEVNALRKVRPADQDKVPAATLYVSLEPCCVYGRTPPCTNLILERRIPRVVISCLDDTPEVNGRGVAILRAGGARVTTGILEDQGRRLSCIRSTFVTQSRPYVILKYARTPAGRFAPDPPRQFWITNDYSRRLVHKWRSETDAVLVGTNTALIDDPQLTNRLYFGPSPLRIVLDRRLRLPGRLQLLSGDAPTLVVTESTPPPDRENLSYLQLPFGEEDFLLRLLRNLAERNISSLTVEGGARLLPAFIRQRLWDEARVLVGSRELAGGLPAPVLPVSPSRKFHLANDELLLYYRPPV